jgi:4-amino-4-deoxy-L-arabinose transferase-like glycosyltransferase
VRTYQLTSFHFHSLDLLYAALIDPARRKRAAIGTLLSYLLLWTLYAVVAKSSQDFHVDMAELIVWSRDLAFGFRKHPPLAAMVVSLWFNIFPIASWSYYLLSVSAATLALWVAWLLSADYLDAEKRVVGLALLTLIPFFNFLALTFNVNAILMPLWGATALWFLRSFRTKSIVYAALAGLGAAACLYAKYWSVFLLFGLGIAALMDAERANYFRSRAPWVTIIVSAALLIPHVVWLIEHDFVPVTYAIAVHGDKAFGEAALGISKYLRDCLLYIAVPLTVTLVAARPPSSVLVDMVWPNDSDRRLVALSFWGPLLSPVGAALIAGFKPVGLWSMSMWTLLPVMLLSPPTLVVDRRNARNILALAIAVPIVSLLVSPAVAIVIHKIGSVRPFAAHAQLLAKRVDEAWAAASVQPLRFVDGDADVAYEVATYAGDRPRALPDMPLVKPMKIARDGRVIVCYADTECARKALAHASREPTCRWIETNITRNYLGVGGTPQRYVILVIPPKASDK